MINAILDFYDDPTGSVLREKLAYEQLPDFVKQAEHLTDDVLRRMPDDNYALVMVDRGATMRKYACTDKGNTALSVLYFMENKDLLPKEAQKVAAANLLHACKDYDLAPPEDLVKLALVGAALNAAMMAPAVAEGVSKHKRTMQSVKRGVPGSIAMKTADMAGSPIMPMGKNPMGKTASAPNTEENSSLTAKTLQEKERKMMQKAIAAGIKRPSAESEKTASTRNLVDITGLSAPTIVEHEEVGDHFCMEKNGQAMYPINSMSQIEQAADYFNENRDSFTPFERHQYCIKLAARADQLNVPMHGDIQKYGSTKLAEDVKVAVYRRQRHFREGTSEHGLLQEMMDKCASIKPEFLAVTLEEFDKSTGMDAMWGAEIPDPYLSVFGMQKTAEWSFQHGNDFINETRLKQAVAQSRSQIKDRFGDELCEALQKEPVQIFDSLPLDHKRIIMRLASENDSPIQS